jgi:hypothetical protein
MSNTNSIARIEYDKGFVAGIKAAMRVSGVDLAQLLENRKDAEEYFPSTYGSGVWGDD